MQGPCMQIYKKKSLISNFLGKSTIKFFHGLQMKHHHKMINTIISFSNNVPFTRRIKKWKEAIF